MSGGAKSLEPPRLVHHNMFGLQPGSGGRRVTARFLKGIEHGWKITDQKVSLDQVSKKALTFFSELLTFLAVLGKSLKTLSAVPSYLR